MTDEILGKKPGLHPVDRRFAVGAIPILKQSLFNEQSSSLSRKPRSSDAQTRRRAVESMQWLRLFSKLNGRAINV